MCFDNKSSIPRFFISLSRREHYKAYHDFVDGRKLFHRKEAGYRCIPGD